MSNRKCIVRPKIREKDIDEYGNKIYYLNIGKEEIEHSVKNESSKDYSYWKFNGSLLGVILKEYSDSKLIYFWSVSNSQKNIFPDETVVKGLKNCTTGFSWIVSNEYIEEISEMTFQEKFKRINIFSGYRDNGLKVIKYLEENSKLLRLAYYLNILSEESNIIIDGMKFDTDWNCIDYFYDSSVNASSFIFSNGETLEISKETLCKLLPSVEDFSNYGNNLEFICDRVIENEMEENKDFDEKDLSYEKLIDELYDSINNFKENPYYKYHSEDGEEDNQYFLLAFNSPEDSYFADTTEEFQDKIIDFLEERLSIVKKKLEK